MTETRIEEVAPGLWRLRLQGTDLINAYLLDDVLVDSGGPLHRRRLFSLLEGRSPSAHALTHAHFDHQGCSRAVCRQFGIPLWCGEGDRVALESGDMAHLFPRPRSLAARLAGLLSGPPHPVQRVLREGDVVGSFTVLETPGHTPGHLAFWREADRALILGDVLFHRNPMTLRRGLSEPFALATYDRAANRRSARRLAALRPETACFGHGEPLRDPAAFAAFVHALPEGVDVRREN